LARELTDFTDDLMGIYDLRRLETSSPDPRVVKLAKIVGFQVEGIQKYAFQWDGKLYSNTMLRKLSKEK